MGRPIKDALSHTRFCRTYEFHPGRRVAITAAEPCGDCWDMVRQKAEQLQALFMVFEDGWSDLSMLDDSLAIALCRLASDTAGDIAGLAELARMVQFVDAEGADHE